MPGIGGAADTDRGGWRRLMRTAFDPDRVKTCTDQKSLESYSNAPSNHPRLEHSSMKARREARAPEEYGTAEFSRFLRFCVTGRQEGSLARKERTSDA